MLAFKHSLYRHVFVMKSKISCPELFRSKNHKINRCNNCVYIKKYLNLNKTKNGRNIDQFKFEKLR